MPLSRQGPRGQTAPAVADLNRSEEPDLDGRLPRRTRPEHLPMIAPQTHHCRVESSCRSRRLERLAELFGSSVDGALTGGEAQHARGLVGHAAYLGVVAPSTPPRSKRLKMVLLARGRAIW